MRILIFFLLELYLFRNHALLTVFFDLGKNTLTLGRKPRAKLTRHIHFLIPTWFSLFLP